MPTEVVMPQMGESIFEGTITKWLKKAGDMVQKDEPLFEISTDKVDAEIPSPVAGVLSEIKVTEGSTVEVNTVVAVVTEAGEAQAADPQADGASGPGAQGRLTEGAGTEIVMPQMGESIFEGTITKWLKRAGDTVQKDEPLFEISTDKVDAEIPSPVAGVLTQIKVEEGATVEINTVVAVIGGAVGGASAAPAAKTSAKPVSSESAPEVSLPPARAAGERLRSSPLVKRIAKENQLDLEQVPGTGSEGRITKEDVLRWLSQHGPGSANVPAPSASARQAQPVAAALTGQTVPMSRMRAIIAQRMVESVRTSPHVYSVYKVDMTRIARLRERERAQFEQKHGVKLTLMPFIAAAAVEALKKFPIVNASVDGTTIHYHDHIHLGIAVALEWGLIVPVVTEAEGRSFAQLAQSIAGLAERARTKKLKLEEATGSTFTLTNSGVFGGEFGTPIINQPESAILAIGGLKKEPVVMTDAQGNDSIAIRWMQNFCLGFDHRTIDGADSGRFMSEFKKALENWERPIL
jgi:2-oxoglutarate dehydrogenase E2 component (dihydrolipoamide succinyltransferase)